MQKLFDWDDICYSDVNVVLDYESELKIKEIKTADAIRLTVLQ